MFHVCAFVYQGRDGLTALDLAQSKNAAKKPQAINMLAAAARQAKLAAKEAAPIFEAANAGDRASAAIREALSAGIDVNTRLDNGKTALHVAAGHNNGSTAVMALLEAPGVDVNALDDGGLTALHIAAAGDTKEDRPEPVAALIAAGAHVNLRDDQGRMALHFAAVTGHTGAVEVLLGVAGIEVDTVARGMTPLQLAEKLGNSTRTTELLKKVVESARGSSNGGEEQVGSKPEKEL